MDAYRYEKMYSVAGGPLALYRADDFDGVGKAWKLDPIEEALTTRADQLIVDQDIELTQRAALNYTFPIGPTDGTVQDAHFHNGQRVLV
jgi:hypothetical protein